MLVSVLFWTVAAVAFSRKRGALTLMDRIGRWFFAATVVVTAALWFFVPMAHADRAADRTVTAMVPAWYDRTLEMWIPNAMLAVSATGAWGATGAGLFFRFKVYTLLGFNWYYLAEVLPWVLSTKAHAGNQFGRLVSAYRITPIDVWPLVFINGASLVLFLVLYAFISLMERNLSSYALPRPDAESAA